jgi:signal transduction histidine kinase
MMTTIRAIGTKLGNKAFWTGIALSLGVGLSFYWVTYKVVEADAHQHFLESSRTIQATLNSRIKSYVDVLRGAASLFRTDADLDRAQFHRYVEGLELKSQFPGIETVNYARHFTEQERPQIEAQMREDLAKEQAGYPEFRISPPGRRAEYTALTYIEPIASWSNRFGVDVLARPTVKIALEQSRDTGKLTASGTLVRLRSTPRGLGMRLPVYRGDMPLGTVEQRRAAYIGSVGIGFSVDVLVNGVLDDLPTQSMRLKIIGTTPDEVPGGPKGVYRRVLLYDNMASYREAPKHGDPGVFSVALPMGNIGQGWELEFLMHENAMHTEFDAMAPWLGLLAGSGTSGLLYALFHALSSSRKRAIELAREMTVELRASEAKLKKTNDRLRRLAAHAENIKEGERKRIAREIHDDLGQNLLALRIEADLLSARTGERHPRLHARAQWTIEQIDATIKSVRQIINDLRPNVLDLGLEAAVDWQINEFRRRTNIACELVDTPRGLQVPDPCATALFRILQESLNNITRHARATSVFVELHAGLDWISMTVADNGIGLSPSARHKPGSFGLVGIEERVKMLGGVFTLSGSPGGGTTVRVALPVADIPIRQAHELRDGVLPEAVV